MGGALIPHHSTSGHVVLSLLAGGAPAKAPITMLVSPTAQTEPPPPSLASAHLAAEQRQDSETLDSFTMLPAYELVVEQNASAACVAFESSLALYAVSCVDRARGVT